jgi:hypothetical protein
VGTDEPDIGPIDFMLIEFPGSQFNGDIAPELARLVDEGLIRILELMLITKGEDGSVVAIDAADIEHPDLYVLAPLASGTLGVVTDEDIGIAAEALEPGSSAGLLVWENLWAIPTVNAVRRAGGQLVASGRIPAQDLIEALEAAEAAGA